MKLWTHHPSTFDLSNSRERIDARKGKYLREPSAGDIIYATALPMLQKRIGTDQFLWCCTKRGSYIPMTAKEDLVEWEIEIPFDAVIFYDVQAWEDIIRSRIANWNALFRRDVSEAETASDAIGALVLWPIQGQITSLGRLPFRYLANGNGGENPEYRKYLAKVGRK